MGKGLFDKDAKDDLTLPRYLENGTDSPVSRFLAESEYNDGRELEEA